MSGRLGPLSTTEGVIADLREEILSGDLAPGARLPEEPLAARLGVARPTVRAAVQALVFEGLLRREPNRPAYIPRRTEDDVRDLYLVRTPIELYAVETLIESGVRPLAAEEALERLGAGVTEPTWTEVVDAAFAFHRGLIESVKSPRLERVFGALEAEVRLCFVQVKQSAGGLPADRSLDHRKIFDAIIRRDAAEAVELMRKHLERGARLSMGLQ